MIIYYNQIMIFKINKRMKDFLVNKMQLKL